MVRRGLRWRTSFSLYLRLRRLRERLPLPRFEAYDGENLKRAVGMRFLLGMIIGALLTIGGAYIADSRSDPLQGTRMVNWTVVGEKLDDLTADLQKVWVNFTRKITGPP
jgi:hypothetical protein